MLTSQLATLASFADSSGVFHEPATSLALILGLGVFAQWAASRLRIPSILLLLSTGLLIGPGLHLVDVDALFGEMLFPLVSLAVGLILFEGGLSLTFTELREIGPVLTRLVSIGIAATWFLTAYFATLLLGFDASLAIQLGAILTVTGPTVTLPLLAHIRPHGNVASLVKWEGIVNDPIGALMAVITLEWLVFQGTEGAAGHAITAILQAALVGVVVSALFAWVTVEALRRHWVPDSLESSVALVTALAAFALSNEIQEESGLFTVTAYGVLLANQRRAPIEHIVEFKENLRVVLLGTLFIMLGARVSWEQLSMLGPSSLAFLLAMILVVRPVSVFLSCLGAKVPWREQVFMAVMAPRGIVAAAVSALFAIKLSAAGIEGAEQLVPIVFLVIVGTVVTYGFIAGPVARRFGLASKSREGVLMLGAHPLAREIARALDEAKIPVVLVDSNRGHVLQGRMAGLSAWHASIRSEYVEENVPLDSVGRLLAMVPNDEVNDLAVFKYRSLFGRAEAYQLVPEQLSGPEDSPSERMEIEPPGRLLFGKQHSFWELEGRFLRGARVKRTSITDDFDQRAFRALHGDRAVEMFVVDKSGHLSIATVERELEAESGDVLISLIEESAAGEGAPEATDPVAETDGS